ncbi:6880_t:CDS:2 [Dentiscutata erythropus]|uniref:6880_t:CDS:1 n=1 Tax=Dentiscutata erythropus TaxID=1348616 RepID=A0A9N8VH70_9GLOM|nr:6880_t:CDS:2 [Dentiscutata erythropus]
MVAVNELGARSISIQTTGNKNSNFTIANFSGWMNEEEMLY